MAYDEDRYLQLSGLQHFCFCRRQWALIHIEQQWQDDLRTTEGNLFHEKAHDASVREKRGDLLIFRSLAIHSAQLGISGSCDVVEFYRDEAGITLDKYSGHWKPYPVEYKRGAPKASDADRLQLCAQAMCLEEMLCCPIPEGALFYGETRRREVVTFSEALREQVRHSLAEMHQLYARGHTPLVKPTRSCNACSLKELCLPKLQKVPNAEVYLRAHLEESP